MVKMEETMKKVIVLLGLLVSVTMVWAKAADEDLMDAALNQKMEELEKAISNGANVNYQDINENTALMLACQNEWLPGVKSLVQAGANVSFKNNYGQTALMIAARDCENDTIVEYLIKKGNANVNTTDKTGKNALMYAIENTHNDNALAYLLGPAAMDYNATDKKGNNSVMYSVIVDNELALKRIMKQTGVNWNQTNLDGNNAFMLAIINKRTSMLRTLITGNTDFDINLRVNNDKPVLFWAIETNQSEQAIGYIMDKYDPEILVSTKDLSGHDINWYIKKYKSSYAKKKLDEIKRDFDL